MRHVRTPVKLVLVGRGPHERMLRSRIKLHGLQDRVRLEVGVPDDAARALSRRARRVLRSLRRGLRLRHDRRVRRRSSRRHADRQRWTTRVRRGRGDRVGERADLSDRSPMRSIGSGPDRDAATVWGEAGRKTASLSRVPAWPEVVERLWMNPTVRRVEGEDARRVGLLPPARPAPSPDQRAARVRRTDAARGDGDRLVRPSGAGWSPSDRVPRASSDGRRLARSRSRHRRSLAAYDVAIYQIGNDPFVPPRHLPHSALADAGPRRPPRASPRCSCAASGDRRSGWPGRRPGASGAANPSDGSRRRTA